VRGKRGLLGLDDVRVSEAGGGSDDSLSSPASASLSGGSLSSAKLKVVT